MVVNGALGSGWTAAGETDSGGEEDIDTALPSGVDEDLGEGSVVTGSIARWPAPPGLTASRPPLRKKSRTNFMCSVHWATECPDIWPYVILGVSVRVFLVEIHI